MNVIGIKKRKGLVTKNGKSTPQETINMSPQAQDIIEKADILIVLGSNVDIDKFKKKHK